MLKIAICTKDSILRKKLELAITQLLHGNQLDFHLVEVDNSDDIALDTTLILGDSDSLYDYAYRTMTIVVLNNHQHDNEIARLGIVGFIEKEALETQLTDVLMRWMDYYFDNYHLIFDELNEFVLSEVLYFEMHPNYDVTVHLIEREVTCQLPYSFNQLNNILPKNFLVVGTSYIINMDYVTTYENGTATLVNGQKISQIIDKKIKEKEHRFDLPTKSEEISIGDKYSKRQIKKSLVMAVISSGLLSFLVFSMCWKMNVPLMFCLLVFAFTFVLFFLSLYNSILNSVGNYFRLNQNGIYYYLESSMLKKARWSLAILNGKEDQYLNFVSYDALSYLRIGTRQAASMMAAFYLEPNQKTYFLNLKFETVTETLQFDEGYEVKDMLAFSRFRADVTQLINRLLLMGKPVESGKGILMALNDPNANLQQYMSKMNLQD